MEKSRPIINLRRMAIVCFLLVTMLFLYCIGTEWTSFRFGLFAAFLIPGLYSCYVLRIFGNSGN